MMNRMAFTNYQSMNMVHRTKDGTELWLGDYYAASNTSLLKQKNIKSVLTSAAMLNISYNKDHDINHKVINAFDIPSYKMTPHFQEAYRFIDDALKKGHILVHCAAGISRSTTFVLVYLMRGQGMSFKQAIDYVRSKRSIICPNYGFQSELKRFQLVLKKTVKGNNSEREKSFGDYQNFAQKKAVLDFLGEDKNRPLKAEKNLSTTMWNSKLSNKNSVQKPSGAEYNGFLRGKSVNYPKKVNNTFSGDYDRNNINKLTKQFLTFKLQNPKIVTIKK